MEILVNATRQENKTGSVIIGKEEGNLSAFADHIIISLKNPGNHMKRHCH